MGKNFDKFYRQRKDATDALLALLRKEKSLSKGRIVDELANRFAIKSEITNLALGDLLKDGIVTYSKDGGFVLSEKEHSDYKLGEKVWCKLDINIRKTTDSEFKQSSYAMPLEKSADDIKIVTDRLVCGEDYLVNGDKILVAVTGRNEKGRTIGTIVSLDKSARPKYLHGVVEQTRNTEKTLKLIGRDSNINFDIVFAEKNGQNIPIGSLQKARVLSYPTFSNPKITVESDVEFGDSNNPDSFERCYLSLYGLTVAFPEEVEAESKKYSDPTPAEIETLCKEKGFVDLRNLVTATTDPDTARDYDDASSIEIIYDKDGKKYYKLYQHIANVGYYATPNSPLFEEAKTRGNTTYLPRLTIPMFPKNLSNGVCSLNPNVDRLALTTIMIFDESGQRQDSVVSKTGKIHRSEMVKSVIHSDKRMTYSQNQQVIDGENIALVEDTYLNAELIEKIRLETELSRVLDKKREKRECLNFDRPDKKAVFDEKTGLLDHIELERETESHRVVENFALETNEFHATLVNAFNEKSEQESDEEVFVIPYVHRYHADPEVERIEIAKKRLDAIGIEANLLPDEINPLFVKRLLSQTSDKSVADFLQVIVLRALPRASYQTNQTGHFGLALENYAQVTSPIRRAGDTFNQIVDGFLLDIAIPTSKGNFTFDDAVSYMKKTENKKSDGVLQKRKHIIKMVKNYLKQQFKVLYGIDDVYAYAQELAMNATRTELNSEKAENEMLGRWCAFTIENNFENHPEHREKYFNARLVSIDGEKVEIEIIEKPFSNFFGVLQTKGKEYKFDLKDPSKNILKVRVASVDKFNNILSFEEDPKMALKRDSYNQKTFEKPNDRTFGRCKKRIKI